MEIKDGLLQGATAGGSILGLGWTRVFYVKLDAYDVQNIDNAIQAVFAITGPLHAPDPIAFNANKGSVFLSYNYDYIPSGNQVIISCRYGTTADPILDGPWVRSTNGEMRQEEWGYDIFNELVTVRYRPPTTIMSITDWNTPSNQRLYNRGTTVPIWKSYKSYHYVRHVSAARAEQYQIHTWPNRYQGKVNESFVDTTGLFVPSVDGDWVKATTLLVGPIIITTRDRGVTHFVDMTLWQRDEGHNPFAYYINRFGERYNDADFITHNIVGEVIPEGDVPGDIRDPEETLSEGNHTNRWGVVRPKMYKYMHLESPIPSGLDICNIEQGAF